jgi:hypothetical protein
MKMDGSSATINDLLPKVFGMEVRELLYFHVALEKLWSALLQWRMLKPRH